MSAPARKSKGTGGTVWLWALLLLVVGVVLLLDNFLFLEEFDVLALAPLLLVVIGAQILLRGDVIPSSETRNFGITRGSVESGTLEISSGVVDVEVRGLQREGRLIAGQYAAGARPSMSVRGNYAHLKMDRLSTSWMSMADWHVGLARDLPWQVLVSTSMGQVNLDFSGVIIHDAYVGTGLGHIRVVSPREALNGLHLHSALGNIHVVTPPGYRTRIVINSSRLFSVQADEIRYLNPEPNVYISQDADDDAPVVEIYIRGTFGDAYLA